MIGNYHGLLVAASMISSFICSYISLDLAGRAQADKTTSRLIWLWISAGIMGLGIWLLHFIGMLSYQGSMPVSYSKDLQFLSLSVASCFSFFFLRLISVTAIDRVQYIMSGTLMGAGISAMHLLGMKAMNLPARIHYDWPLLLLSVLIAVMLSFIALLFARIAMTKGHKWWIYSALMMGAATSGMHYTAMKAVRLEPSHDAAYEINDYLMALLDLFMGINLAAVLIFMVLLGVSLLDRKRLNESEQKYKSMFDYNPDLVCRLDVKGEIVSINNAAERLIGYRPIELVGTHFETYVLEEDREKARNHFQLEKKGAFQECQLRMGHKNGNMLDVAVTIAPLIADSRIRGCYMILKDITDQVKAKMELQKSEIKFRSVIETAVDAIVITDKRSQIVSWNKGAQRIFHYAENEMLGKHMEITIPYRFRETHRSRIANFQKTGTTIAATLDLFGLKKNGDEFPLEMSLNSWNDGEEVYFSYIIRDITQRRQVENTLFEAESKYRSLVEKSLVGVYIVQNGKFVYANPRLNSILGYESVVGLSLSDIILPADRTMVEENLRKRLDEEIQNVKYQCRVKTNLGRVLDIELFGARITYNGEPAVIGNALDITESKQAEQLNEFLANHDPLTELPNRRLFENKLVHAIDAAQNSGQGLAMMYLDLDRFKTINDTLGHSMGDRLLMLAADRMRKYLGDNDVLARMGGDEFTLFMPKVSSSESAVRSAKEILEIMRAPFLLDNYELHVTTSIGISLYPIDGKDSQELMKYADTALYRAKDQGKDGFCLYNSSMKSQNYARFVLENDLHKALKHEQFELFYQPRMDVHSGKVIAAEALLRWNHPEMGWVPPCDFIPLLEETGLIIPVGEWVLREVCRQRRTWIDAGFPLVDISINFSAQQFLQKDITDVIKKHLSKFELDSQWLEIEITETSLIKNGERIIMIFDQLKAMGIKLALDDFGTGYSSLAYLRKFQMDILKIDQSFIRSLQDSHDNEVITIAIINLAKGLDMTIVAEGVETELQKEFLTERNCDQMQGYLFSRPVSVPAFESFIMTNRVE